MALVLHSIARQKLVHISCSYYKNKKCTFLLTTAYTGINGETAKLTVMSWCRSRCTENLIAPEHLVDGSSMTGAVSKCSKMTTNKDFIHNCQKWTVLSHSNMSQTLLTCAKAAAAANDEGCIAGVVDEVFSAGFGLTSATFFTAFFPVSGFLSTVTAFFCCLTSLSSADKTIITALFYVNKHWNVLMKIKAYIEV